MIHDSTRSRPLKGNSQACVVLDLRRSVRLPSEVILDGQLRRPGMRVEDNEVLRIWIPRGDLPGDALQRVHLCQACSVKGSAIPVTDVFFVFGKSRARHTVMKLQKKYAFPSRFKLRLGITAAETPCTDRRKLLRRFKCRFREAIELLSLRPCGIRSD